MSTHNADEIADSITDDAPNAREREQAATDWVSVVCATWNANKSI